MRESNFAEILGEGFQVAVRMGGRNQRHLGQGGAPLACRSTAKSASIRATASRAISDADFSAFANFRPACDLTRWGSCNAQRKPNSSCIFLLMAFDNGNNRLLDSNNDMCVTLDSLLATAACRFTNSTSMSRLFDLLLVAAMPRPRQTATLNLICPST